MFQSVHVQYMAC